MPSDLTLREPILPTPQRDRYGARQSLDEEVAAMKGAAVGPFTMAPDLLGLMQQAVAPPWMKAYYDANPDKVFSGDPIRELVGLDPDDPYGMAGEMLGGWENAIAKGITLTGKAFSTLVDYAPHLAMAYALKQTPTPGQVNTLIGATGVSRMPRGEVGIQKMGEAAHRLDSGEDPVKVLRETGWVKGGDGEMKLIISDKHAQMKETVLQNKFNALFANAQVGDQLPLKGTMGEMFDAELIYRAYPDIRDMPLNLHLRVDAINADGSVEVSYYKKGFDDITQSMVDEGHLGAHEPPSRQFPAGRIHSFNSKNLEDVRSNLLHEIQHGIQRREGWAIGANSDSFMNVIRTFDDKKIWKDVHNFWADTEDRWRTMSSSELKTFIRRDLMDKLGMNDPGVPLEAKQHWFALLKNRFDPTLNTMELSDRAIAATGDYDLVLDMAADYLRTGEVPHDVMAAWLRTADWDSLQMQAMRRYLAAGGEIEARAVQAMKDKSLEEIYDFIERNGGDYLDTAKWASLNLTGVYGEIGAKHGRFLDRAGSEMNPPSPLLELSERAASDPQANWHAGQSSGRGGTDWGPANDVPNEGSLVGASKLPEGTQRIVSEEELKLLANTDDVDEILRILREAGVD